MPQHGQGSTSRPATSCAGCDVLIPPVLNLKGYLLGGVAALLVISLLGNVWQHRSAGKTLERAVTAESALLSTQNAAKLCSDSVRALKGEADKAAAAAKVDIDKAKAEADARVKKARAIVITPPSVPGDDCRSALDRARSWQKGIK